MNAIKPKILIIYTGGTIGMIENPVTHALQPFDFTHLIDNVPKICKELGIPQVYAKASSELHGKILLKLGADQVIYPDRDSAHRLAHTVMSGGAFDLLEISEGCSIAEIDVPESCAEKTLAQADLRKKTGVTVLCIRRLDENPKKPRQILIPGPTDMVRVDDKLIVFGTRRQIDSLTGGGD